MNIIIFGATELGCLIATEFFEDHDITIIDKEETIFNKFQHPCLIEKTEQPRNRGELQPNNKHL